MISNNVNIEEYKETRKNIIIKKCKEKNYILIEPFIYSKSKDKNIHLKCLNDNYDWFVSYDNFINGNKGCPKCGKQVKPTQQEAKKRILQICEEKNYTLLNKDFIYIGGHKTRLYFKCNIDKYEWNCSYNNFINNYGCTKCGKEKLHNLFKLTQEEAENNVRKKCKEKNYKLIKSFIYINNKTVLYLKCLKDEYEWKIAYFNFINGDYGCPKCSGVAKITQKQAENNVKKRCEENKYELIKSFIYKNEKTRLYIKCNIHNCEWNCSYSKFIHAKHGCPECAKEKRVETMIERYGEIWLKYIPKYNSNSILYLDMISEKLNIPIQHALNGGEMKFKRYFVDGYISDYNICIEWNEYVHYHSKKYINNDIKKKQFIEENYKCHIIYINEKEILNDIYNQINLICDKINEIINNLKINKIIN